MLLAETARLNGCSSRNNDNLSINTAMRDKIPIKLWDMVIIIFAFLLTVFSALNIYAKPSGTGQVIIQCRDSQWIFPLDANETLEVPGPLGKTVIKIQDRHAWVESSPCRNQICVAAGHVQRQGIWIACLPNNVFLMIDGNDKPNNEIDAFAW